MSDETPEKRKCTWERLWFASYSRVCLQQQTEERRSKTSRSNVEEAMSVPETMVPRLHPTTQLPKATSSPLPGFGDAVPPFCYPSPSELDMARDCGDDSIRTELCSVQPILHSVDVRYFVFFPSPEIEETMWVSEYLDEQAGTESVEVTGSLASYCAHHSSPAGDNQSFQSHDSLPNISAAGKLRYFLRLLKAYVASFCFPGMYAKASQEAACLMVSAFSAKLQSQVWG
jgi:hypothetical protein